MSDLRASLDLGYASVKNACNVIATDYDINTKDQIVRSLFKV